MANSLNRIKMASYIKISNSVLSICLEEIKIFGQACAKEDYCYNKGRQLDTAKDVLRSGRSLLRSGRVY